MSKVFRVDNKRNVAFGQATAWRKVGADDPTIDDIVTDGDTVKIRFDGRVDIRFLGIDTPEKRLKFPNTERSFFDLDNERWLGVLPATEPTTFIRSPALVDHVRPLLTDATLSNQLDLANSATTALSDLIAQEFAKVTQFHADEGLDVPTVPSFWLTMTEELFDGFARVLAYVDIDKPRSVRGGPTLNERLLIGGHAMPYFIWPNVVPYLLKGRSFDSIPPMSGFAAFLKQQDDRGLLARARSAVADARTQGLGVFRPGDPLRAEAFELRYLLEKTGPKRFVIDMDNAERGLLAPEEYISIPQQEARLYVNPVDVPLFMLKGWVLSEAAKDDWARRMPTN